MFQVTEYEPKLFFLRNEPEHFKTRLTVNNMYLYDVHRLFLPNSLMKNDIKGKNNISNKLN